jgi:hypothetical protein
MRIIQDLVPTNVNMYRVASKTEKVQKQLLKKKKKNKKISRLGQVIK